MAKRLLTFTRWSDERVAENKDAIERQTERFYRKHYKRGDIVPESIKIPANALLTDESRALAFSTRHTFIESMREVLRTKPYLALGLAPFMYDSEFPGITFVNAEDESNDAS